MPTPRWAPPSRRCWPTYAATTDPIESRWHRTLLAPGRFATEVRRDAATHNARIADVLGTHPAITELVRRRYRHAQATHKMLVDRR